MDGAGVDVREKGAAQQVSDRRLFLQLLVWTGCPDGKPLVAALERSRIEGVLYHDLNDPAGIGLLTLHENPAFFATELRDALHGDAFAGLRARPEMTMLGRTYASGYEADLADWLLVRPRRTVLDPACPWGIWYPLRRSGAFARAYGDAGLAHDVRLACHGLDTRDNDFVIGLIGRDLHPLSHLVQAMRRTAQTSQYLASLGPFFVGHVLWQSPGR